MLANSSLWKLEILENFVVDRQAFLNSIIIFLHNLLRALERRGKVGYFFVTLLSWLDERSEATRSCKLRRRGDRQDLPR